MSKFSLGALSAKSSTPEVAPAWRADFRKKEALPDVKVIRTDFLINYGLVGLALVVLGFALKNEYAYVTINSEINKLVSEIDSSRTKNEKNLADSGVYSAYASYVDEYIKFKSSPVDCLRVLSELGSIRVGEMSISNILIDTTLQDSKTKKSLVKIMIVGRNKGVTPSSFSAIEEAFGNLNKLNVWSELKEYKIDQATRKPPVVSTDTKEQMIDYTFEITLVPAK